MFGKRKKESFGFKNREEYTPAFLPKNVEEGHTDLSMFITGDYSLLNLAFLEERYRQCERELTRLIQLSDTFSVGEMGDAYVDANWEFVKNKHEEEVAMHEVSGENIKKARLVRIQELKGKIPKLREKISKRQTKINNVSDKRASHAIRIGKKVIQLGLPITVLSLVVDLFVNTAFLENLLYSNQTMLRILVLCLCLMSDGTMYALGILISKKPDSMSTRIYHVFSAIFISLFLISVFGSIAIRIGSMGLTYGDFDSTGTFIPKEEFSLAEWTLALISSLATAVTGLLSLYFSFDPEYCFEKEYWKLKAEQEQDEKLCMQLESELASLEQAVDPMICDRERRKAAEANLEGLRKGLKIHVRKLLALHQQDASYSMIMSESAKKILEKEFEGGF